MKASPDLNDTLRTEGEAAVRDRLDNARRYKRNGPDTDTDSKPRLIIPSKDFIAGFVPPDYLWDGVLRRRFIYSLTARTGDGKTAVALLLSAHVGLGRSFGDRNVEKGRVLYLAGENPDDIQMRWIAMAHMMSFDANATSTSSKVVFRSRKRRLTCRRRSRSLEASIWSWSIPAPPTSMETMKTTTSRWAITVGCFAP
jgi:hypothetical protein